MTIWKYSLNVTDHQRILMPIGGVILCVQMQALTPTLWVKVDPNAANADRTIIMHGTGHSFDDIHPYIGTFQIHGGALVFHVFDGGVALQAPEVKS